MRKVVLLLLVCPLSLSIYFLLGEKTVTSFDEAKPVGQNNGQNGNSVSVKKSQKNDTGILVSSLSKQSEVESVWNLATITDHNAAPHIRADVQNATLIKPNSELLSRLQKGDSLNITIPQSNQSYTVAINQIKRTASGSRVITGKVVNTIHSVVFTLGPKSLFGTISTPEAIYNLNGRTDLAWLVAARELNYHVDPRVPDYIIVDNNINNELSNTNTKTNNTSSDITNDKIMAKSSVVNTP